jgi:hypothetical protein
VCATVPTEIRKSRKLNLFFEANHLAQRQGFEGLACRRGGDLLVPATAGLDIGPRPTDRTRKVPDMLYTIAVVLLILWVLGLVSSYTLGGFIHILLVVAVVMILLNLISGRRSA